MNHEEKQGHSFLVIRIALRPSGAFGKGRFRGSERDIAVLLRRVFVPLVAQYLEGAR